MSSGLLQLVATPFCQAVMLERWNAERGRFFVDYRVRHGLASVIGTGVIDEFHTISAPIFIAPAGIIGGVYDAGMRLADERDVEAPIDQGWPPLTIGVDVAAPAMPHDWKRALVAALQAGESSGAFGLWKNRSQSIRIGASTVEVLRCFVKDEPAVTVIVTNAALLPQQLGRLADTDHAAMTVAVATGNRLPFVEGGELHAANAASEAQLQAIAARLKQLFKAGR